MKKVEELHPQMTAKEKENQADGEEETVIDIDAKPEITFDDFGKMQFQVGEIISCEAVPKSKKRISGFSVTFPSPSCARIFSDVSCMKDSRSLAPVLMQNQKLHLTTSEKCSFR